MTALLSILAASTATGSARASVIDYLTVQPIDICDSLVGGAPTGCAPFNTDPTATTVGFAAETQKIFNEAGVSVVFLPVKRAVTQVGAVSNTLATFFTPTGAIDSNDFRALSRPSTVPAGSPAIAKIPNPDLRNPNGNVINLFFAKSLIPPSAGFLFGMSWLNNNGVVLNQTVFSPPSGFAVRRDTLAHELLHNLNVTHTSANAVSTDIEAPGNIRTIPGSITDIIPPGPLDVLNASQIASLLLSPFLSGIPLVNSNATGTGGAGADFSPTNAITVAFDKLGVNNSHATLQSLKLTLAPGTFFGSQDSGPLTIVSSNLAHAPRLITGGRTGDHTLTITFAPGDFGLHGVFSFFDPIDKVGSCVDCGLPFDPALLIGAQLQFSFSDGYNTTSDFAADLANAVRLDSQDPDPGIPPFITGNGSPNDAALAGTLPNGDTLEDANPKEEGTAFVAEPSTLALLLPVAGLVALPRRAR